MAAKRTKKIAGAPTKYEPEFADRAYFFCAETGVISKAKLAKLLGTNRRTIVRWLDPEGDQYQKDFADALKKAQEGIDSGAIKQSIIKRAQDHTETRVYRELQRVGPKLPDWSLSKKGLILYAEEVLKLEISGKLTKDEIRVKIEVAVEKKTTEAMKRVREEDTKQHGDVAAARLVLPNIGPEKERWTEKQKLDVNVTSLADIAALMNKNEN